MLFRILLLLALVFLGIFLLRKMMGSRNPKPGEENQGRSGDSKKSDPQNAALIRCAHCGVHLPQSDAFWREGQAYCSSTHRNLGPKKR